MKLTIEIDMSSAAFEDNEVAEVRRILQEVDRRLDWSGFTDFEGEGWRLRDLNGNRCGLGRVDL